MGGAKAAATAATRARRLTRIGVLRWVVYPGVRSADPETTWPLQKKKRSARFAGTPPLMQCRNLGSNGVYCTHRAYRGRLFRLSNTIAPTPCSRRVAVSYTHLTLPTSD